MHQEPLQHADTWAAQVFGAAELGDPRRTDRLIKIANALAENPSASLPHAFETWGGTQGGYRFLRNPAFGYEDLILPHWSQTYYAATHLARTLLLADTTEFDFTRHNSLKGRGPVGNSRDNIGFSLHTVLAMDPQTQEILGCMMLTPFIRQLAPLGETKAQRKKRVRESRVWEESIQQIGQVPEHHQWIYVSDSNSDVYTFWQACEELGYDFVLRVAQDRNVEISQGEEQAAFDEGHLKTLARALPGVDVHLVSIPAQHAQPRRDALLQINFQKVRVQPPLHGACFRKTEIVAWVVRVWESQPPEGQEPLEWILLATLPITCPSEAWEVVQWYGWRWLLEDFHKALKTGCRIEQHNVQSMEAQWKLLAVLTPIALRLLIIRHTAQEAEETPATNVISPEAVQVLLFLDKRHRSITTAKEVWHAIARLGGYLDRKSDGPPGWQTLWKGWMRVMDVLDGVHLAALLHPS
ncbi:IS4 family transposase [Ktedonospora formicarum]|uniref:IS4 family transposase n=1 Tax=Ktedonospora formicarum TaxID=2778364 RepID=A0A8J3IDK6_9CHLR|nr:IS4 family transposase [Ktedonospora formicarum]GHO50681.1 IS4 family transposase [Ktedonospora formicarum]GHO51240.1 IS4 family transposase [Ktedonospora formicarum]